MKFSVQKHYITTIFLGVILLMISQGCEQPFDPLKENDRYYYSIFGVLDASVDTQWVRVMPVRDSILTSPEPHGAEVTIKRISTGETITMQDSLFELRQGYYAWNYWTDAEIHPGEEYQFSAVNAEGDSSIVEISVPPDYPTPIVDFELNEPITRIYVEEVERLTAADIIYYFHTISDGHISPLYSHSISQMDNIRIQGNAKIVSAYPIEGRQEIADIYGNEMTQVSHRKQEVLIVSGGPGWPDYGDMSEPEQFLPEAISNVENGLGVLAGIVSKRLPLKSCYDENDQLEPCPLLKPRSVVSVKE